MGGFRIGLLGRSTEAREVSLWMRDVFGFGRALGGGCGDESFGDGVREGEREKRVRGWS